MIASRTVSVFAALCAATSLPACIGLDDETDLGESTSELSTASWTGATPMMDEVGYAPAMAMLNGVEYYVYSWDPGGSPNPWADPPHELYWHQCDAFTCTSPRRIPGQNSLGRVSLAAFNGYIYMVHQGDTNDTAVWFSRLDVTTGQWTTNSLLPFTTFGGSPALAAFNNRLYIVGSEEREIVRRGATINTYPIWYASMSPSEAWSSTAWMTRESASPPSLAVLGNKLYVAHRNGAQAEIVIQSMPAGGTWTAPSYIPAGPGNTNIQGDDVQIAAVNGYLHLTHHRFSGDYTYWTYNRGCDAWAPEVSVDGFPSSWGLSMSTGITGLVLNRIQVHGLWPYDNDHYWYESDFIAPPAPETLPNCGAQG